MLATATLQVTRLSKTFGGQRVLHNIEFDLQQGEIHALVGENGCGKSTFIKCLAGYYTPDVGAEISVHGRSLHIPFTPVDALVAGLSFIHQNLGLIGDLTVLENLALSRGFATGAMWKIDWTTERGRAAQSLEFIGPHIRPEAYVRDLTLAEQTMVAIARCLQLSENNQRSVLVLDEPTAALPREEIERLFSALRNIAAKGVSIVYVSHRLNEILRLGDRVTVLRNGRVIKTTPVAGLSERDLAHLIIGRSLDAHYPPPAEGQAAGEIVLETCKLAGPNIRDVNLTVRAGEIVGIAGLLGSGRSELGRILFGAQKRVSGKIWLGGSEIDFQSPADGLRHGVGYVPQDRLRQGGFWRMSVAENVTMPDLSDYWRNGRLHHGEERYAVERLIQRFNIRPNAPNARFSSLSGGNQQKAILARMFRLQLKLLILDEPVQGIDIGSKSEIYRLIEQAAGDGMGVVLIDSDFEDLCRLCHRIIILNQWRITAELSGSSLAPNRVSELVYLSEGSL